MIPDSQEFFLLMGEYELELEKELERKRNWKRNGYGSNKKTNMVSQLDNVSCPQGKWNGKQQWNGHKTYMVSQPDNVSFTRKGMKNGTWLEHVSGLQGTLMELDGKDWDYLFNF